MKNKQDFVFVFLFLILNNYVESEAFISIITFLRRGNFSFFQIKQRLFTNFIFLYQLKWTKIKIFYCLVCSYTKLRQNFFLISDCLTLILLRLRASWCSSVQYFFLLIYNMWCKGNTCLCVCERVSSLLVNQKEYLRDCSTIFNCAFHREPVIRLITFFFFFFFKRVDKRYNLHVRMCMILFFLLY